MTGGLSQYVGYRQTDLKSSSSSSTSFPVNTRTPDRLSEPFHKIGFYPKAVKHRLHGIKSQGCSEIGVLNLGTGAYEGR